MDASTIVLVLGTLGMLCGLPPCLRLLDMEADGHFGYLLVIPVFAALMYALMTLGVGTRTFQGHEVPLLRYLDWLVTTPILVGYAAYVAGVSRQGIVAVAGIDAVMIGLGTAAVVFAPPTQWVFFGLSALCHVALFAAIYGPLRKTAWEQPPARQRLARLLLNHVGLIWLTYPVVWLFGPGLQLVSATGVTIMIMYMDVIAKVPYVYFVYRSREVFVGEEASSAPAASSVATAATA